MKYPKWYNAIAIIIGLPAGFIVGIYIVYNFANMTNDEFTLNYFARIGIGENAPSGKSVFLDFINGTLAIHLPRGGQVPEVDLRGTWKSSTAGKGFKLRGSFEAGGGTKTTAYAEADAELIIDSVKGNQAYGTMRITDYYTYAVTTIPGYKTVTSPRQLVYKDTGADDIVVNVSGNKIDFGSYNINGAPVTLKGTFDYYKMTISMSIQTPNGPLEGVYDLTRHKQGVNR